MSSCPYCRTNNIGDTVDRGISQCHDCGAEFRGDTIFKEGSYRTFMENVLNKVASSMAPQTASMIMSIRNNVLNDKNDIDSIVEKLIDMTEMVNNDNVVGIDRTNDVVDLVEGIEKITTFAKVLAKNSEISPRTAERLAMLEGTDPSTWMFPPEEIPDLPGEVGDVDQQPSASDIISAQAPMDAADINGGQEPPVPAGAPAVDKVWQEGEWMGEKVKFNVTEVDGKPRYDVRKMDESPIISYNEETDSHDGIDQFSEEQLTELDSLIAEHNKDVMSSMSKEYGADKAKQIYYATANKQGRNPENFHKVDELGMDRAQVGDYPELADVLQQVAGHEDKLTFQLWDGRQVPLSKLKDIIGQHGSELADMVAQEPELANEPVAIKAPTKSMFQAGTIWKGTLRDILNINGVDANPVNVDAEVPTQDSIEPGLTEEDPEGQIGGMSDHDIDVQGIDNIDPTYNAADDEGSAEGTVVSTETQDPAAEAAKLSAPMLQQGADGVHDQGAVDEGAKSVPNEDAATELKLFIDNDGNLYRRQYEPIIKNLQKKIKRGVYDSELAVKAFMHLAYSGANEYIKQHGGDISAFTKATRQQVAQALRDDFEAEYKQAAPAAGAEAPVDENQIDGPIGAPAAQAAPGVDGGIGKPVVDEAAPEVDGPVGQPADGTCDIDGGIGQPVMGEDGVEGVVEPEGDLEVLGKPAEDEEHEEAEADAVEVVGTKAEKAQAKIESAEEAIAALKDAVDELSKLDSEEAPAGEGEALQDDGEDKPKAEGDDEDDLGDVEPVEGSDEGESDDEDKEKLEELEKKKTKAGFDLVKRAKAVPSTREVDGKKPTGHVVGYVSSMHDPSKPPSEQWTEEETAIPFTQSEAEKDLVDEEGVKVKKPDYSNTKDADMDKLDKKVFDKNRIDAKKLGKVEETTRFNGYRLGDHIKVPGYSKSFELKKITTEPDVKFHLSEGRVSITVDPLRDTLELDEDKDIRWQRTTSIIEDTRAVWEQMEKELIKEDCNGGVCNLASPMSVQNTTSGLGTVMSAMPVFVKTPIRTLSAEATDKDIYAYIKNNNLHTVARETALGHIKGNFVNTEVDVEKIYEDAVASMKYDDAADAINEVDNSYGYKTKSTRSVDIDRSLNEGYDRLKDLGIV